MVWIFQIKNENTEDETLLRLIEEGKKIRRMEVRENGVACCVL